MAAVRSLRISSRLAAGRLALAAAVVAAVVDPTRAEVVGAATFAGNFVVVGGSAERAAAIVARAEALRTVIQSRILGADAGRPWRPPCELHVHATAEAFSAAVGMRPWAARGATSLEFTGDRVSLRRIDLIANDGPDPIPGALAHEIVHVVLGDRFLERPPPRWADEGLAVLFDPPEIRRRHEADFRTACEQRQAWSVRELLALDLDPADIGRQRVFYGQSGSLVRWLLDRGGAQTLLAFLEEAPVAGQAAALRRHYGFDSPEALDTAWRADLPPP